jgi:hypothetical protein
MANLGVKCVIFFVRRVELRDRGDINSLKKDKKQQGEKIKY